MLINIIISHSEGLNWCFYFKTFKTRRYFAVKKNSQIKIDFQWDFILWRRRLVDRNTLKVWFCDFTVSSPWQQKWTVGSGGGFCSWWCDWSSWSPCWCKCCSVVECSDDHPKHTGTQNSCETKWDPQCKSTDKSSPSPPGSLKCAKMLLLFPSGVDNHLLGLIVKKRFFSSHQDDIYATGCQHLSQSVD